MTNYDKSNNRDAALPPAMLKSNSADRCACKTTRADTPWYRGCFQTSCIDRRRLGRIGYWRGRLSVIVEAGLMSDASDYRKHAKECIALAVKRAPESPSILLLIAKAWLILARGAETGDFDHTIRTREEAEAVH